MGAATPTIPSEERERKDKQRARSQAGEIISVGRRNTYNTIRREREREKSKEQKWEANHRTREEFLLVKMSRFVFITTAIIRSRFVFITTLIIKTLCK